LPFDRRLGLPFALAAMLALSLALAGCGRKGPLDPPPSAALPPPAVPGGAPPAITYLDPTTPTGGPQQAPTQTSQANPPAAVQKKTFLLDPLLQ
jgi:predicted small lipoprotein YifL